MNVYLPIVISFLAVSIAGLLAMAAWAAWLAVAQILANHRQSRRRA